MSTVHGSVTGAIGRKMAVSKLSENWQENKSLVESNQYLLENGFGDVTFKLQYQHGEETADPVYVPAVRSFLLARSPVFFSMFSGGLANKEGKDPIYVNDVEPEAFHQMLRFIYTDQVQITAHNVLAVLNASKKYIVTNLTKKCVQFLKQNIRAETAAPLLEQAMIFDVQELKDKVLAKIEEEPSKVLPSEDFVSLSKQAVREVLQLELKVMKELDVFEASMRWAEKKCQQMNRELNGLNKRDVLGDNLFLIRFPTMSVDDMNDTVLQHDVLSPVEALQLMRYITAKSTTKPQNIPFPTKPRDNVLRTRTITFPLPKTVPQKANDLVTDLNCNVSKPIHIKRLLLHVSGYHNVQQYLQITISQNRPKVLNYNGGRIESTGIPNIYAVAVNDVRVEAGAFQLHIAIGTSTNSGYGSQSMQRKRETPRNPQSSQQADDYVTISVSCVTSTNLLHGIEYTPVEWQAKKASVYESEYLTEDRCDREDEYSWEKACELDWN